MASWDTDTTVYREYRRTGVPAEVPGFCKVASLDDVRGHKYALTPGRYVGVEKAGIRRRDL
jgi:type I restriction-modification system DNA methylase subunit